MKLDNIIIPRTTTYSVSPEGFSIATGWHMYTPSRYIDNYLRGIRIIISRCGLRPARPVLTWPDLGRLL